MNIRFIQAKPSLGPFFLGSLLVHGSLWLTFHTQADFEFSGPIVGSEMIAVTLAASPPVTAIPKMSSLHVIPQHPAGSIEVSRNVTVDDRRDLSGGLLTEQLAASAQESLAVPVTAKTLDQSPEHDEDLLATPSTTGVSPESTALSLDDPKILLPPHGISDFMNSKAEKLTYQVSMLGVPVGSAVLEASAKNGELRIKSTATSNKVTSIFYPVNNLTETRMFNGRYIMTTIRLQQGDFESDIGYTLCFPEKHIFWADRLKNKYVREPMLDDDVLDVITGFYSLRQRSLSAGKSELLNIYDSNKQAAIVVDVLRKEQINLPGSQQVSTIVVHPRLMTDGFFHRNGEIMVWLTDDDNKVPVRMETTVAIGKIRVDLIAAETER